MKEFKTTVTEKTIYVEAPSKKYAVENGIWTMYGGFSREFKTSEGYMYTFMNLKNKQCTY
jgi:hypothetical protein